MYMRVMEYAFSRLILFIESLLSKLLFFFEGLLLYRILLFSVKSQHESAIGIPLSPPSEPPSHLPPQPTPSRLIQSPCLSFLSHTANSCWLSILHIYR